MTVLKNLLGALVLQDPPSQARVLGFSLLDIIK